MFVFILLDPQIHSGWICTKTNRSPVSVAIANDDAIDAYPFQRTMLYIARTILHPPV